MRKDRTIINRPYERDARSIIEQALVSLSCFVVSPVPIDGLRALLLKARNGVSVDLIVPTHYVDKVGVTDRYLAKLKAAGGRFFLVEMQPEDWRRIKLSPQNFFVLDDREVWQPTGDDGVWRPANDHLELVRQQLDLLLETGIMPGEGSSIGFQPLTTNAAGWNIKEKTLTATFSADADQVRAGDQVRLYWSVPEAEKVDIQPGPGRVPATGSRLIRLTEPTEFILTARREKRSIAKVLKVKIDRRVSLEYSVMIGDPLGINTPSRLNDRPELPGYFGLMQGQLLTLHWRTINANKVLLDGVEVRTSGEYTFFPEERKKCCLQAVGVLGDIRDEQIVFHAFAPRVALPKEVLAPVAPEVPVVSSPLLREIKWPALGAGVATDPLAGLDEELQRDLRSKWRKNGHGLLGGLRNWLKTLGK